MPIEKRNDSLSHIPVQMWGVFSMTELIDSLLFIYSPVFTTHQQSYSQILEGLMLLIREPQSLGLEIKHLRKQTFSYPEMICLEVSKYTCQ